jgi:hypothetical protein
MKRDHCRGCYWVEPTGKGTRGDKQVDIGLCHGDTPKLTDTNAGAFPPVTLDIDFCRHFTPTPEATKAARRNLKS